MPARRATTSGPLLLLVIDEAGYVPFGLEAANLFFHLVSARYERASLIAASNEPFDRWAVFGDGTVAAMIDRLVHHVEAIALKGNSYRLKTRDLGRAPGSLDDRARSPHRGHFPPTIRGSPSAAVDRRSRSALTLGVASIRRPSDSGISRRAFRALAASSDLNVSSRRCPCTYRFAHARARMALPTAQTTPQR